MGDKTNKILSKVAAVGSGRVSPKFVGMELIDRLKAQLKEAREAMKNKNAKGGMIKKRYGGSVTKKTKKKK